MSEEQLINKIKNNPDLFGSVYDEHYHTIFNYCYKRTKDFNASKDITSETFLKAFLNIKKFKWKSISLLSEFFGNQTVVFFEVGYILLYLTFI